MKPTLKETIVLINYYDGLMHDLDARMVKFENTYNGAIDYGLFQMQQDRNMKKLKSYESRIAELKVEFDKANNLKKKLNSIYGVNSDKEDNHEN